MNSLHKLKHDKRAVVWVWVVILVGLFIYSLVWFATGFAVMEVADNVESQHTFEAPASYAADFIKTVFQWHPLLFIFGMLLWGYVNSQREARI